jgi:hypothetical protein
MAKRRGRGSALDRERFPDFEGVAGMEVGGGPNVPGANRGGVGRGAFIQPSVTGPQRRIDGLRASRGNSANAPGQAVAAAQQISRPPRASSAPSAAAPVVRPVQGGTGALPPGAKVNPRFTGRPRSRRG